MGFGLTQFVRAEYAVESVNAAQNTMLDRHVLRLQVSKRNVNDEAGDVS